MNPLSWYYGSDAVTPWIRPASMLHSAHSFRHHYVVAFHYSSVLGIPLNLRPLSSSPYLTTDRILLLKAFHPLLDIPFYWTHIGRETQDLRKVLASSLACASFLSIPLHFLQSLYVHQLLPSLFPLLYFSIPHFFHFFHSSLALPNLPFRFSIPLTIATYCFCCFSSSLLCGRRLLSFTFRSRHRFIPRLEFQTLLFTLPRTRPQILDLSATGSYSLCHWYVHLSFFLILYFFISSFPPDLFLLILRLGLPSFLFSRPTTTLRVLYSLLCFFYTRICLGI